MPPPPGWPTAPTPKHSQTYRVHHTHTHPSCPHPPGGPPHPHRSTAKHIEYITHTHTLHPPTPRVAHRTHTEAQPNISSTSHTHTPFIPPPPGWPTAPTPKHSQTYRVHHTP